MQEPIVPFAFVVVVVVLFYFFIIVKRKSLPSVDGAAQALAQVDLREGI